MGGWWLLALAAGAWIAILATPFVRGRVLLLAGTHLPSVHLLLAAAILADAAIALAGMSRLPVPLSLALAMTAIAWVCRDAWLLLGPGEERALERLEELCKERGIETDPAGGRLVLKRLGTAVARKRLGPGFALILLDRRRREPEVDRIAREWRRRLATGGERP